MKLGVTYHSLSEGDLKDQAGYFVKHRHVELAERYVNAVRESIQFLTEFPYSGSRHVTSVKQLQDVRCWSVKDFPHHVIYYRVMMDQLSILRVLHGSRKVTALLRETN
jgi:plasmid stabilization system protein ParE